jgi:hypothetical protein
VTGIVPDAVGLGPEVDCYVRILREFASLSPTP